MAKSEPQFAPLSLSTFLLLITILLLSPTCQAEISDGPDATTVSKDVTQPSPVCECGPECGTPCLYSSPPPPGAFPAPSVMSPPEMPSPELYSPPPPPLTWPWPTPMPPYPWYKPPPPRGEVYSADGGFEFYKPSIAWHRGVNCAQLVLVCAGILALLL